MIVRCNNCVSAFAVDDEKVANKKFAFTCPKCSSENIIDNRIIDTKQEGENIQLEESYFNDDFSVGNTPDDKLDDSPKTSDSIDADLFLDETSEENKESSQKNETKDNSFDSIEDEFATEYPADELLSDTGKKDRNLNLEIEESADLPDIDDEDIFSEKSSPAKKDVENDLLAEVPAFEADDGFISFDEKENVKVKTDEIGIELKDDTAKQEDDDIFFDDFDETPVKPQKKDDLLNENIIEEVTEFDFEDIDANTIPADSASEREKKLSSQDDIDALFAEEGIVFDEKPISKESEINFEDEITVDLDLLDIDLEDGIEDKTGIEKSEDSLSQKNPEINSDDITLDIDNLDIDLDDTSLGSDMFDEPVKSAKKKEMPLTSDEDITLDIDNLDIDLDDASLGSDMFDEPVKSAKKKEMPLTSDEDITLDIDNLDIDLDDAPIDSDIFKRPAAVKSSKAAEKKVISPEDEFIEDDIKLNLDDLDIDLAEIEDKELIFEDDLIEETAPVSRKKSKPLFEEEDEDESITIDLDTLELEIADENNSLTGELSDEDEKLTLDDAGLTFEELTSEMNKSEIVNNDEEDIKLTIDDIDPDLTLDIIAENAGVETERLTDTLDELPEIDLDEYDAIIRQEESRTSNKTADDFEDEFVLFPDIETETHEDKIEGNKYDYDILDFEESDQGTSSPERGSTFFSIDFSLKYSRIGALLRLLGLYSLSMIPHFIVMVIYTILSSIVGFINQIVILSTGRCVEDFALVIENTMRYFFYIKTCITGIVEDRPEYAGRESLDHPLQMNITYPVKYSKNLAIMRLSIVGILLITLPHLILMSVLSLTIPLVYLAGIITVIITRRWPNLLFIYLTKYFRYLSRIASFMTGLTDEYPPFNFD